MHIVIYRPTVLGFNKTFVTLSKVTQMHFCHKKLAKEASLTMQEILLQVMLTAIEANIILNMLIKI